LRKGKSGGEKRKKTRVFRAVDSKFRDADKERFGRRVEDVRPLTFGQASSGTSRSGQAAYLPPQSVMW